MQRETLGGQRLGSGKKMDVTLPGFASSTHDLSRIWRSTMSAGTLVPFLSEVMTPGDEFYIDLNADCLTHPTVGPLFGSFKLQLDVFMIPLRLYNSLTHLNTLEIGLDMSKVKFPMLEMTAFPMEMEVVPDIDTSQINPSCVLAYMGLRGIGLHESVSPQPRRFNMVDLLMYWDTYKNYYAALQEGKGAVIHRAPATASAGTIDQVQISSPDAITETLVEWPATNSIMTKTGTTIILSWDDVVVPATEVMILLQNAGWVTLYDLCGGVITTPGGGDFYVGTYNSSRYGTDIALAWRRQTNDQSLFNEPNIATFDLTNIDEMRMAILAHQSTTEPFIINDADLEPYSWLVESNDNIPNVLYSQEGLAIKTYQSDLLNNWLRTEFQLYVSNVSSVSTAGDSFGIDALILAKNVYNMLNRIMVTGGTYSDWVDTMYDVQSMRRAESPVYMGGLIKELVFQEVVSNSPSENQPLGTLAGKGRLSSKHKGGHVVVKTDEPAYVMGIVSLTPRIDYSQGNHYKVHMQSFNDLHVPSLDEIGFQDLITEQMAWWDTHWAGVPLTWSQNSAGKQPAWSNYMTAYNQTYGNFAIKDSEMFMTLNRRYQYDPITSNIQDLTSYIDPTLYNNIFADTALDAQNFWVQIAIDIKARRRMSAKLMPNL